MKKCNIILLLILSIFAVLLLTACPTPVIPEPEEPKPPSPPQIEERPPQVIKPEEEITPHFPLAIIDDLGRNVTIPKLPQRIVSLAPSNTEILYALGLEDKIVGVTDYCDYPAAAKAKQRVASYTTPNIEKLVSLEPDLILAESIHEKTVLPSLENLGFTVIVSYAKSLDNVLNYINLVGEITGKSSAANKLVADMGDRIEAVKAKIEILETNQKPKVLYLIWHEPIWTMGSATFTNDLIQVAGGINIFAEDFKKSRVVSYESIISKNPNIIIVSGMGTSGDLIYNSIKKASELSPVDAMINNRIYKISDSNLTERPGPRIVDGLEEMAGLIHPALFGKTEDKTK